MRERWEMDVVGKQASRQIHLLKKKDTANLRPAVNQTVRTAVRTVSDNDRINSACMHIILKIKNAIVSTPSIEIKIRLHSCIRFNKSFKTKSHTSMF